MLSGSTYADVVACSRMGGPLPLKPPTNRGLCGHPCGQGHEERLGVGRKSLKRMVDLEGVEPRAHLYCLQLTDSVSPPSPWNPWKRPSVVRQLYTGNFNGGRGPDPLPPEQEVARSNRAGRTTFFPVHCRVTHSKQTSSASSRPFHCSGRCERSVLSGTRLLPCWVPFFGVLPSLLPCRFGGGS